MDYLTHEDDQLLAVLREATTDDMEGDGAVVADMLDGREAIAGDVADLSTDQLNLLLAYAKIGRNAWLRHILSDHAK